LLAQASLVQGLVRIQTERRLGQDVGGDDELAGTELKSRPFAPHPLFALFIEAAVVQSRLV